MPATLSIRLLGPVGLELEGQPLRGFESRKAVALLGYLAVRRQPLTRSHLADLLWGDKSEAQGRNNLSRVLHNLNSLLPGCFQNDHYTVEFKTTPETWLDVAVFEAEIERGSVQALAAAVDLYRDEFLAGLYLDDCPDFELWLVAERERWRERVVQALQGLLANELAGGEEELALKLTGRLLELEPAQEEAHRQRMLLLARTGQPGAAIGQFETCRRALAAELGVEPSPETVDLYNRIRQGEIQVAPVRLPSVTQPKLPPVVKHNLPPAPTSFVGRQAELAELAERLADPACRLLTLVGPGGVGKTRLAQEAVSGRLAPFPDGVYFVPLASLRSARFLLTALIDALDFSPEGSGDPQAQVLNYLREKRLLLLLDNFEHLLDGSAFLLEILRAAPHVKIVVTSVERLNVQAEWLYYVQGLDYPRLNQADSLEEYTAARLFLERARSIEPHLTLTSETRAAVIRICQLVDGMPLGLELAAAWVGKFAPVYIAREMERNLDFLTSSLRDLPPRHRSLRAAIEWSTSLLNEPERVRLRQLAVFAGGFTPAAAQAVTAGLSPEASPSLLQSLSALVDKSLLTSRATAWGEPRFQILGPIREYAEQLLVQVGEQALLRQRHAAFFLAWAEESEPKLTGRDRLTWLARLEGEYDNLRAALAWALADPARSETGLRLAAALIWFWYLRNTLFEGREWVEKALAAGSSLGESPARAKALFGAGAGAWLQGDYATARLRLTESLQMARVLGERRTLAYGLTIAGLLALNQGEVPAGRGWLVESVAMFRELKETWGLALALTSLELAASAGGEEEAARAASTEGIGLFRELNDPWGLAVALNNLGVNAYRRADYVAARERHAEALAIRRQVGDKWLIAQSLYNLGKADFGAGDYDAAKTHWRESLELDRELESKRGVTECLEAIAGLAAGRGQLERAARLYGAAEAFRNSMGALLYVYAQGQHERNVAGVRAQLDWAAWNEAWNRGHAMSLEQAVDEALHAVEQD